MAVAGGLSAQFGFKPESTYGTAVVVDQFVEFNSETIKNNIERIESGGLRATKRVLRDEQRLAGRVGIDGDTEFEVQNKGMGTLLKHAFGAIATSQPSAIPDPTVYEHKATVGQLDGKSLTVQVGRTGSDGTTRAFTYAGMQIGGWELTCDVDGILMFKPSWVGASEVTNVALATASYATDVVPLTWTGGSISIGGTATPLKSFSLAASLGRKDDRYFMSATTPTQRREALEGAGLREYTGNCGAEFVDLTAYNRFVSGAVASLTAFFTGPIISNAYRYALEVTCAAVQFDGETPNVGGADLLEQPLPFKVLDSGAADGPIAAVYRTDDATVA